MKRWQMVVLIVVAVYVLMIVMNLTTEMTGPGG
jgi:hypothetical protein